MKKMFLTTILILGMAISFAGCGSRETMESTGEKSAEQETADQTAEDAESTLSDVISDEATVINDSEKQEENQYEEQKDIFVLEHIDIGDGTEIDLTKEETDEKKYTLPESIDIYSYFGTYAGYTKPDIYVGSVGRVDGWVSICFAKSSFLAKAEDFDRVAVAEEDEREKTEVVKDVQSVSALEDNAQTVNEPVVIESVEGETSVQTSDKYTPDEAIAVYRGLMEAGGMTWNPELKDVSSWGTGWIFLEKGQPEWTAETNLKSAAYGDGVGNPWTQYYLEVTGSDDECVYITEWHN